MPPSPRDLIPSPVRDRLRTAYRGALGALYRGDRVECPCCGGRFRTFLPFGVVRRENAMCPACGSLERHRLLWLFLERSTEVFTAPLRLLHVAPERRLARRFASLPNLSAVSVDLESPLAMARMDATRLGFRAATFDVVLCLHVLEHVSDDRAAMGELFRVLKPGGWGLLQSPVDSAREQTYEDASILDPAARERAFGQRDHVRIYGLDYVSRLRAAGFEVEERAFASALTADQARRFGLDPAETLTICTRPAR